MATLHLLHFHKVVPDGPTDPLYQHFMCRGSIASYYKCNEAEVIEAFYWLLRSQVYCHPELAPYSLKQTADTFFKKWQLHLFHDQKSIFISIKTRMQFSLHLTDVRPAQSMTLRKRHKFKVLKILHVTRMQLGFGGKSAIAGICKQSNMLKKIPHKNLGVAYSSKMTPLCSHGHGGTLWRSGIRNHHQPFQRTLKRLLRSQTFWVFI